MSIWQDIKSKIEKNPLIELQDFEIGKPLTDEDLDLWEVSYNVKLIPELRKLYAMGDGVEICWLSKPEVKFEFNFTRLALPNEFSGRIRILPIDEFLDDEGEDFLDCGREYPELRVLDFYGSHFAPRDGIGMVIQDGTFLPELQDCSKDWCYVPAKLGRKPVTITRYLDWMSHIVGFRTWPRARHNPTAFIDAVRCVWGKEEADWVARELDIGK